MKRVRIGLIFVVGLVALAALACGGAPRWIHALPDGPRESARAYAGLYVRPADSRFGEADKLRARSVADERLQLIEAPTGVRYRKMHRYREYVDGRLNSAAYQESGAVERSGPWLLLRPDSAESWELERTATLGASELAALAPPDDAEIAWRRAPLPPALRFYADPAGAFLAPVAYDRLGTIYPHGVFEGMASGDDANSSAFQAELRVWTEKRYFVHAYFRESRQSFR